MADIEKVIKGMKVCLNKEADCGGCPYEKDCEGIMEDSFELLKKQQEERKRMLLWLSKFCRHIDNGDKWLTDEENLAFFKEKMKQQFGWDTD